VRDLAALQALRGPWGELAAQVADDSPYLTPEFLLPWLTFLSTPYDSRVLTAWEGPRLLGLAPVFDRRFGLPGLGFTVRSFPISGTTPPFDVLALEPEEVLGEFVRYWRENAGWDLIRLQNVRADSPSERVLRATADRHGLKVTCELSERQYLLPIRGTWEEYCQSRSRRFRKSLSYDRNCCERIGPIELLNYPREQGERSLEEVMGMAFEVMRRSWKRAEQGDSRQDAFFLNLAAEMQRAGRLSLRVLLLGGRPVAYLFEIDYRGNLHAFHIAYDLELQQASPGMVILAEALKDAHARGAGRYDFGGTASYLEHFTKTTAAFNEIRLTRDRPWARAKATLYLRIHRQRRTRAQTRREEAKVARKSGASSAP
jgi:CelD/BcsL family acetyltransferase involved in cellulose biosynthesis